MIRAFIVGILVAASVAGAFAAELPELNILELCKRDDRGDISKLGLRLSQEALRKLAYTICIHSEVAAKRDARWRLRMLSEERQETCIEQGVAADTYTAMGTCLDKFTGFLHGP